MLMRTLNVPTEHVAQNAAAKWPLTATHPKGKLAATIFHAASSSKRELP